MIWQLSKRKTPRATHSGTQSEDIALEEGLLESHEHETSAEYEIVKTNGLQTPVEKFALGSEESLDDDRSPSGSS